MSEVTVNLMSFGGGNMNGRIYPEKELEKIAKQLHERLKKGEIELGKLEHPQY